MVMREKEDDLSLFRELRENEKTDLNLIQNSEEFEAPCGLNHGNAPIFNLSSSGHVKKKHADEFPNTENEKSDYDWLLTPPGTPLIPTLEKEPQKIVKSQAGNPRTYPTALSTRLADSEMEPLPMSNLASENSAGLPTLNASGALSTHPSSSSGKKTPAGRSSIPTARTSLPSKPKVNMPSRQSTPTSRAALPSKPTAPVRSSAPTRSAPRSSTPTARLALPASKSATRSSTPTHRPASSSTAASVSAPPRRSSSATRPAYIERKNPAQSRGTSPMVRSRHQKPSEMPAFSNDAPTNQNTVLRDRPGSASKGRKPVGGGSNSGNSVLSFSKARLAGDDDVNPVLMGTKMVERVVNMRRLPPPKQDSPVSNDASRRFSSIGNSGFGRSLSKKSLDMAMRHMNINRSIQGDIRPLRSGGSTKSKSVSASDSLATSSSASSEPSMSNNSHCLSGSDLEDNGCSLEGTPLISISQHGS